MDARRLIPLLAAALALTLVAAAPADAAKAKRKLKPCSARGDTTWNRTTVARVYAVGSEKHSLYGCMYDTGRRRRLASWYDCDCGAGDDPPPTTWLTGRFVAIRRSHCAAGPPPAGCSSSLRVVDIRTGRAVHSAGAFASDLVLKRNGSIAYVAGQQVVRVDASGVAVVDEGPGIEAESLAANRRLLYWTRGGVARSAPFD